MQNSATNSYRPFSYVNGVLKSFHQSPCSGPKITSLSSCTKPARQITHEAQLSVTRAIVTYGAVDTRLSIPQREDRRLRGGSDALRLPARRHRRARNPRGVRPRTLSRGSFGARLRRRCPQYGHSVI